MHYRRSLSSAEKTALANLRGALRQTFEKQLEEFWSRSAAESQLRAETDSEAAFAHRGPQECHRALERSWRQARNADVLLAVRLGTPSMSGIRSMTCSARATLGSFVQGYDRARLAVRQWRTRAGAGGLGSWRDLDWRRGPCGLEL